MKNRPLEPRIWGQITKLGEATGGTNGHSATGLAPVTPQEATGAPTAKPARKPRAKKTPAAKPEKFKGLARAGSKTERAIAMLQRKNGATLDELMTEFGWLPHTTRAFLSAGGALTKKFGLTVASTKTECGRTYSIAS